MDRVLKRQMMRSAKQTTIYIIVTGIAFIIIFPMFFLFSFSFMSDYETYSEWPKPLIPSFRVDFMTAFTRLSGVNADVTSPEPTSSHSISSRSDASTLSSIVG